MADACDPTFPWEDAIPSEHEIVLRDCISLDDFQQCVIVQRRVWGFADEDLIPVRFFVVARKIEGQVLGAFEASGRLVGFCLAVPALHGSTTYLHSHMLAVLPEHRKSGIGRRLKLEQRRDALDRGIKLIEWTFDPLEWKNALLNLNRLGAIARRYVPNQYGFSSSPLHRGLPTDRLIVEWWLDSPRVIERLGERLQASNESPVLAAPSPSRVVQEKIELPLDILEHPEENHARIAEVQRELRSRFEKAFAIRLAALGFEAADATGTYLLGPAAD